MNEKEKEKEVYEYLLDKIKEADEANLCDIWCCALDRFCSAIRTKAGG